MGVYEQSESDLTDLLPDSLLNFVSSPTRLQASLDSTLSIHESPQSHETTSSHDSEQETDLYNMPEKLTAGSPLGKVPIARGIDRSNSFRLAKLSGDVANKLWTKNLHGRFRIYSHDLTEGSIVGVSQSRTA